MAIPIKREYFVDELSTLPKGHQRYIKWARIPVVPRPLEPPEAPSVIDEDDDDGLPDLPDAG